MARKRKLVTKHVVVTELLDECLREAAKYYGISQSALLRNILYDWLLNLSNQHKNNPPLTATSH